MKYLLLTIAALSLASCDAPQSLSPDAVHVGDTVMVGACGWQTGMVVERVLPKTDGEPVRFQVRTRDPRGGFQTNEFLASELYAYP